MIEGGSAWPPPAKAEAIEEVLRQALARPDNNHITRMIAS
jgi:hypothetical protein